MMEENHDVSKQSYFLTKKVELSGLSSNEYSKALML